jgi:hypothetical protein
MSIQVGTRQGSAIRDEGSLSARTIYLHVHRYKLDKVNDHGRRDHNYLRHLEVQLNRFVQTTMLCCRCVFDIPTSQWGEMEAGGYLKDFIHHQLGDPPKQSYAKQSFIEIPSQLIQDIRNRQ